MHIRFACALILAAAATFSAARGALATQVYSGGLGGAGDKFELVREHKKHSECFLSVERPLDQNAKWSAECGGAGGIPPKAAVNRLDELAQRHPCNPDSNENCRFEGAGAPLTFDPQVMKHLPLQQNMTAPSCYPPSHPEWVRIGFADFNRSCFRGLADGDNGLLLKWAGAQPDPGAAHDQCQLDKFGEFGSDPKTGAPLRIPAQKKWARDFYADYPPRGPGQKLGTAAEAIAAAMYDVLEASNSCIEAFNPGLAQRLREAMGVNPRGGTSTVYRPSIECQEQEAYRCHANKESCDEAKDKLKGLYTEHSERYRSELVKVLDNLRCRPAHAPGTTLGSIDVTGQQPGQPVPGSPRIQLFNPTARFAKGDVGGRATLLHELLHAAGAESIPQHNEGFLDDHPPAGDRVYACQALAYQSFFEHLDRTQLRQVCLDCAEDAAHKALCLERDSDYYAKNFDCRR